MCFTTTVKKATSGFLSELCKLWTSLLADEQTSECLEIQQPHSGFDLVVVEEYARTQLQAHALSGSNLAHHSGLLTQRQRIPVAVFV